ncbi:MDIS1-interacting receptor like kinase 2-like [Camellia sinensis]|uniref:MDIS1-interacting receptor like kinase 2-like n=1 Tax=Camellia sinensis TaxID=4442 RepID=UPI001036D78A|nr:MDIS1-interacting receptor like kinase 2-like [Camellia sinensis]
MVNLAPDLEGEISRSLQNCSLKSIDLGGNKLSGKLPSWLGETISELWMLQLQSNSFNRIIPQQWCNFPNLHILDLVENNISGIFDHVNVIDLSPNNLMDEIPEDITRLIELGTLNFSWNQLTGNIPEKIESLRLLETLDLSRRIRSGNQLQALDDSSIYSNNPLLCRFLLSTKCLGDEDHTSNSSTFDGGGLKDSGVENDNKMLWFYISMEFGFLLGLCGVCFTLWIKESWRKAYF